MGWKIIEKIEDKSSDIYQEVLDFVKKK